MAFENVIEIYEHNNRPEESLLSLKIWRETRQ